MRVYLKTRRADQLYHTMYVTLVPEHQKGSRDWPTPDGTRQQIPVKFVDGVADVSEELGRFMLENDFVQKSRPLVHRSPHVIA